VSQEFANKFSCFIVGEKINQHFLLFCQFQVLIKLLLIAFLCRIPIKPCHKLAHFFSLNLISYVARRRWNLAKAATGRPFTKSLMKILRTKYDREIPI
jgi:hypothetical protein